VNLEELPAVGPLSLLLEKGLLEGEPVADTTLGLLGRFLNPTNYFSTLARQ
jgi:hypothetical protein